MNQINNFLLLFIFLFFAFSKKIVSQSSINNPINERIIPSNNKLGLPQKKGLLIRPNDPEDSKRWAIVIGVNGYNDVGVQPLNKARNDAKIIGQILKEQGEFDKVFIMTDDIDARDSLYPTKINIEEKLDTILEYANPYDTFLFYFSGHGVSDEKGNGFILPVDTIIEKVNYTSIKVDYIINKLNERKIAKSLIILDACRDRISTTRTANREGLQADKFQNAEVGAAFFSTKAGYYSFEDPGSDFGVFSKYIAYGMEGKADSNEDGIITFSELEEFVQREVNNWSLENNKKQKPFVRYYKEKYGDIPITVKGYKEKSLVEKNNFKSDQEKKIRLDLVWRSAIFPGWGQYHYKETFSAYLYGSLFTVGLLYNLSSYSSYIEAKDRYFNDSLFIATAFTPTWSRISSTSATSNVNFYSLLLLNNISYNRNKAEYENRNSLLNGSAQFVAAIYLINLIDAFAFRNDRSLFMLQDKKKEGWSLYFSYFNPYSTNILNPESMQYNLSYTWSFK